MENTDHKVRRFRIVRRTSQYNKYIKWFAETFHDDGVTLVSSCGYRTEREARESVKPRENPFPIGNRWIHVTMQEIN
jgi:hypothetical protein